MERATRVEKVAIDGATRTGIPTVRDGRHGNTPASNLFHGKGRPMEPSAPLHCQTLGRGMTVVNAKLEWIFSQGRGVNQMHLQSKGRGVGKTGVFRLTPASKTNVYQPHCKPIPIFWAMSFQHQVPSPPEKNALWIYLLDLAVSPKLCATKGMRCTP